MSSEQIPASAVPTAITVGTFDGVHRGHRRVVEFLLRNSEQRGLRPLVITFEPHPLAIVAPQRAPHLLELPAEREANLRALGVDVEVLRFDEELRRLTVEQWMLRLRDDYNARLLVAGYDNTFGSDGMTMNIADYREIGRKLGIDVLEAPIENGVSSTLIRHALLAGDVETAAAMLGRPYALSGTVAHGRGLGRQLGFPTANLLADPRLLLPAPGVYAADANGMRAVVNIGVAPTVDAALPLTVEAHLIGFSGNLYGAPLRLEFLRRLRDEKRFGDLRALQDAIAADILSATNL